MIQQANTNFESSEQDYAVLPGKMQRGELEGLLMDVAHYIGMSDGLLRSLLTMMRETRPSDWTDPAKEPVCFAMQGNLAFAMGKDERSVRRDEAALERQFQFLHKDVAANGTRCRLVFQDGEEFRQGLCFSPLIEAVPDLVALRDQMRYERQHKTRIKRQISALKRKIKQSLMRLQPVFPENAALKEISQAYLGLPTRYEGFRTVEALQEHFLETSAVVDNIEEFELVQHNMSGRPDSIVRPYIQDTTQEPYVSCNTRVDKRADCMQSEPNRTDEEPIGSPKECLENKHGGAKVENNNEFLEKLTPQRMFALSSQEMQLYISYHQGKRHMPSMVDFVLASIDRLAELGINKSAYNAAIEQMGDVATALCIMIIDRNRFHPETPIKNPGGVLRAMTQRHSAGKLNLVGSLIGLTERLKIDD